tara:strand:- start:77 stop:2518 length:2442 start_codon:yes stop_codon:yes gene_type:complete
MLHVVPAGILSFPSGGYVPAGGLYLDGSADYLTFTPSQNSTSQTSSGDGSKFTLSMWVKRSSLGSDAYLFESATNDDGIRFDGSSNQMRFFFSTASSGDIQTSAAFRDPTAWQHWVFSVDTDQGTSTNRVKLFLNGAQISDGSLGTNTYPAEHYDLTWMANGVLQTIGRLSSGSSYFGGYLTEVIMLDGTAVTDATSFGEYNSDTGIWVPVKPSGLTFGNNGFHLDFADSSALGNDVSGNNNDFTANSIAAANSVNDNCVNDADNNKGNYATINPLAVLSSDVTLSEGNTKLVYVGDHAAEMTIARLKTGKWYWELKNTTNAAGSTGVIQGSYYGSLDRSANLNSTGIYYYNPFSGQKVKDGSMSSYGSATTTNDILQVALDLDNNKIWWGINNTWQNSGDPAGGTNAAYTDLTDTDYTPVVGYGGAYTSILNTGQTALAYTPPAGFKLLNTANLSESSILKSTDHCEPITYDGTGSELEISSLSFQPGFVIIKNLDATDNWMIYDNVRGATVEWHPNSNINAADSTTAETLKSFDSDGFTLGTDNEVNTSSEEYLALCWKTGSSGTVSNAMTKTSDSSQTNITRTVNTDSGLSIMKYTGNGSASTILHGLGKAPKMLWVRPTNKSGVCKVWHVGLSNATRSYVVFATTAAEAAFGDDRVWGPDPVAGGTTSIGVGTHTFTNNNTDTYIAYAFAEVEGFSKFGSYTGNGSTSQGRFVYTGFKPSMIFIKSRSSTTNWAFYNDVQKGNADGNPTDRSLRPSTNETDANLGSSPFDIYSNGFRSLTNASEHNATGVVYTYSAFARSPFSSNNRAR